MLTRVALAPGPDLPAVLRTPKMDPRLFGANEWQEVCSYRLEAERRKESMRDRYAKAVRQTRGEPRGIFLARSREQWTGYQAINDELCPDDPVYSKAWSGLAYSTTNSTFELGYTAAQNGQLRVLETYVGGEATASAVLRVFVARVSAQGTGAAPTTYTPEKFSTRSPPAVATCYGALTANAAWATTQETLNANPLIVHAINAFGGTDRWVPQPGEEIYVLGNGNALEFISMRSNSGTSVCSGHAVWEEM